MNLPEYNTTNCKAWEEYWDNFEDARRFICLVCGRLFPPNAKYYHMGHVLRPVCKADDLKHKNFHKTYDILDVFEQERIGNEFNACTVTLKLSEEGII